MKTTDVRQKKRERDQAAVVQRVGRVALAQLLGITEQTVSNMAVKGVFKEEKGEYVLKDAFAAYLKHDRAKRAASAPDADKKEAAQRLMSAKADIEEMKARTMRSELMHRAEMEEECMGILAAASAELMSVPDDIAGQGAGMSERPLRKIAADRINTALENLKSNLEEMSRER